MRIKQIIKLATEATKEKDNLNEGAVGSNGYGFVFKDFDTHSNIPFITPNESHKFCGAGAYRDYTKKLQKHDKIDKFSDLLRYNPKLDLLLAGSLKRIVPTLQFGGIELLFKVWMFVLTPKGQMFPAIFYWGQSGLSIGGWSKEGSSILLMGKNDPLKDFPELKNFSPFEFTEEETNLFHDALEFALKKVPVSDFWGIYTFDLGHAYMEVKRGRPLIEEWE